MALKWEINMSEEKQIIGTGDSELISTVENNDFAKDINLFDEQIPSEAELRGEEPAPEGEESAAPQPQEKEETPTKPQEEVEEKEKPKHEKPPIGFVPKEALKEERTRRQALQSEIADLKAKVEELARAKEAPPVPDEFDEFKVLTQEEYENLVDDDIVEAQKYLHKLNRYEKRQAEKYQQKATEAQHKKYYIDMLQDTKKSMEDAIPGLFDEDDPINDNLVSFAKEHGMDDGYLYLLSNPATRIVDTEGRTYYMGQGSVGILKMIYNLYNKTSNIEPALRKKLTDELSVELAKKIKNGGSTYTSIGDLQKAGTDDFDVSKTLSESELSKMSPEKRRKYLGG
jgi:hypothetical protein